MAPYFAGSLSREEPSSQMWMSQPPDTEAYLAKWTHLKQIKYEMETNRIYAGTLE